MRLLEMDPEERATALRATSTGRSRAVLKAIYKVSAKQHKLTTKEIERQRLLSQKRMEIEEKETSEPVTGANCARTEVTGGARRECAAARAEKAQASPDAPANDSPKQKLPEEHHPDHATSSSVAQQAVSVSTRMDGYTYLFGDKKEKEVIEPLPLMSEEHTQLAELYETLTRYVGADVGHEISRAERRKKAEHNAKGCLDLGYGEIRFETIARVFAGIKANPNPPP